MRAFGIIPLLVQSYCDYERLRPFGKFVIPLPSVGPLSRSRNSTEPWHDTHHHHHHHHAFITQVLKYSSPVVTLAWQLIHLANTNSPVSSSLPLSTHNNLSCTRIQHLSTLPVSQLPFKQVHSLHFPCTLPISILSKRQCNLRSLVHLNRLELLQD